ncbi:MAG: hypothetical protein L0H76_05075 [Brevibacterium sp.]|nr:hypothetical protein [Brevibacterium sp.]
MTSRNERMRLMARALPTLALLAWVVTIWVPVLDSASSSLHTSAAPRIVVTSYGRTPVELIDLEPEFVIIWIGLLTCVISAWIVDSLLLWAWATTVFGIVVLAFLVGLVGEPPTLMWDGQDGNGEWVGGMAVGYPAVGAAFWAVGGIALIGAGVCGLIGERLRSDGRPGGRPGGRLSGRSSHRDSHRDSLRISRWFETASSRDDQIRVRRHRSTSEHAARLLPLVSVAAWVAMIWVPIMASRTSGEGSVILTSLGRHPIRIGDLGPDVLLPWAAVLICAAIVWIMDPPTWWSVVVILIGVGLFVMLQMILIDPPTAYFSSEDSEGEPFGATIIGRPAAGASYWILGSGALVLAGILGCIRDRRMLRPDRLAQPH